MIEKLKNQKSGLQLSDQQINKQYFIAQLNQNNKAKRKLTNNNSISKGQTTNDNKSNNMTTVNSEDKFYNLKEYGKYA